MSKHHSDTNQTSPGDIHRLHAKEEACPLGYTAPTHGTEQTVSETRRVPRGITTKASSWRLQQTIWLKSLMLTHRFRVIRTIDIAVHCFAERPFKAALSAAQRAVRGMVKAKLIARYRTDRFMTVYGLTQRGADWLDNHGVDATASVRRVSDMTNPEHRLWAQFLTVCAEARGLRAQTEQELLLALNRSAPAGQNTVPGLLRVTTGTEGKRRSRMLRPDAACFEADGMTWFEVDRSARGADRAASLRALALSIGEKTETGDVLRRVVLFCRSERITNRIIATLSSLAASSKSAWLTEGRRMLIPASEKHFEVWMATEKKVDARRSCLEDVLIGHVIVQELPVWLPRVRLDGRGGFTTEGWFSDNYLPYRRPASLKKWSSPICNLT